MKGSKRIGFIAAAAVVAIAAALVCTTFAGCADIRSIYTINSTDYGLFANYHYSNGDDRSTFSLSGSGGEWVEISWDTQVKFNTLLIEESGSHVTEFEITVGNSAAPVYRQDEIGDLRLIYLGTTNADKIRITVTESDGDFKLTRLGVYNVPRDRDFVTTDLYFTSTESSNYLDPDVSLDAFADSNSIILSGNDFKYDADGSIGVDNDKLASAVSRLKSVNPFAEVYVLLTAADNDDDPVKVRNDAMGDNKSALGKNIVRMLSHSGADGIVFDFTDPGDMFSHNTYNDFIEYVRGLIPSPRQLGVYVNCDDSIFNDASKSYIDTFYVIAHNEDSSDVNPASFNVVCHAFEKMYEHDIPTSKVQISIPLFGMAADSSEDAPEYYPYSQAGLGQFDNAATIDGTKVYFNGYTLVRDKAAFAYGYGMKGVVLIDYAGDAGASYPYSLHKAIKASLL